MKTKILLSLMIALGLNLTAHAGNEGAQAAPVIPLGQVFILNKGDVLTFPGDKPHSYKNDGISTALGISIVFFGRV